MKKKIKGSNPLIAKLINIKNEKTAGVITYLFKDGTKQTQNINKSVFYDYAGKNLPLYKVLQLFNDISHDLGAVEFELT